MRVMKMAVVDDALGTLPKIFEKDYNHQKPEVE